MKQSLRILFLFIAVLTSSVAVAQKGSYEVQVRKANVRTQPSTKSAVIGSLSAGSIVEVTDIDNGWAKVKYQGKRGYISARLLKAVARQHGKGGIKDAPHALQNHSAPSRKKGQYFGTTKGISRYGQQQNARKALWRFGFAIMPQGGLSDYGYGCVINLSGMLGGDFPLRWLNNRCTIETGLRYLYRQAFLNKNEDVMSGNHYLEIPVRLAYDLPLNRNLALRIGAGPYVSYGLTNSVGFSFGLEPALSLKYKNFSAGVQYSAPLVSGDNSSKGNVVMVNLSIRFGGKAWGAIGKGMLAVGEVSQTVLDSGLLGSNSGNEGVGSFSGDSYGDSDEGGDGQVLITKEINRLQNEIMEMRHASIDYSGVIRIFEKQIEWLQKQQDKGRKYVSKEEYEAYKAKKKKALEKAHKQSIDRMKRYGDKSRKVFESKSNL